MSIAYTRRTVFAQMHLSRTLSAVTTLMLMTTECFCTTRANVKLLALKTKTPGSTSHRTNYQQWSSNPANVLIQRPAAPFTGVCCMSAGLLSASRRLTGETNSDPMLKVKFEDNMLRNPRGSYRVTTSPIRASDSGRPHTALSKYTRPHRPVSVRDRQRSNRPNGDARQLQSTRSMREGAARQKSRRRPPLIISELPSKGNSEEPEKQQTDNDSKMGGWTGDPEVVASPLVNKVNRDFAHKYFVGKRQRAHYVGLAPDFNLAQLMLSIRNEQ